MNSYYNQNYTKKEIDTILKAIKSNIRKNRYTIAFNEHRKENLDFINEYNIRSDRQKSILNKIKVEDFCHTIQNTKKGYEDEILYVFVPQVHLYNADGEKVLVDVYVKLNMVEVSNGSRAIVISFHKRNKPITYMFR